MKILKTAIVAATMLSSAATVAVEVSGNVAIGSEYFFRGVDQSSGAAVSGGFDVAHDSGVYVGTWASSVNFSDGLELDYYVGYGGALAEDVSYDVGYIYFDYPHGPATEDFQEFYGSMSYSDLTLGLAYSNDYYASSGSTTYVYFEYGMALNDDFDLGFHYGTMSADKPSNEVDDYSLSLSTEAAGLGFDLSWIHSSESGDTFADNEFVLTVSKSM